MATVEKVDTRWFQGRLADKRLSQRKLAARLGLDPAAVSLMLRGRRKMTVIEAKEIARALGVEVGEVLGHLGGNVVRGPGGRDVAAMGAGVGASGVVENERPRDHGGAAGEFEAEFMQRWIELGSMLLRRRG